MTHEIIDTLDNLTSNTVSTEELVDTFSREGNALMGHVSDVLINERKFPDNPRVMFQWLLENQDGLWDEIIGPALDALQVRYMSENLHNLSSGDINA
ncbi:hypothetical protein [Methylomonas sp. AM2-LC]|uniref:hypothetical protein n=1 Tax=Methylomonas sp. AM2-LC TaxID=3153301 RepID=UPI003265F9CE